MTSTPTSNSVANYVAGVVASVASQPSVASSPGTVGISSQQVQVLNKVESSGNISIPGTVPVNAQMIGLSQPTLNVRPSPAATPTVVASAVSAAGSSETKPLDKRRLQELVKEVDPLEQLDEDVEEVLLQIADDFIESVVTASCQIAKHRKSSCLDVKDVQLHLERNWNMWIPGFGSDELRPYKKACTTEAHKQRMALIRKTLKKS